MTDEQPQQPLGDFQVTYRDDASNLADLLHSLGVV